MKSEIINLLLHIPMTRAVWMLVINELGRSRLLLCTSFTVPNPAIGLNKQVGLACRGEVTALSSEGSLNGNSCLVSARGADCYVHNMDVQLRAWSRVKGQCVVAPKKDTPKVI